MCIRIMADELGSAHFFADLLLKLPDRAILTAVLTLCERAPLVLFRTWLSLAPRDGASHDFFFGTLPEADRAEDCPILEEEEDPRRCRRLPCGHAFHEDCLRRWFRARTACPVCGLEVLYDTTRILRDDDDDDDEEDQQSSEGTRDAIRDHLALYHPGQASDWVLDGILGFGNRVQAAPVGLFDLSSLLLKMPYRSTLTAIITLFERRPETLAILVMHLQSDGVPRDVVSTLPETDRVEHCPKLDPLREFGRVLSCGHSFHDTCLRYWFRVRKGCPVCEREVDWNENMPPLLDEDNKKKDRLTIDEMLHLLSSFLLTYHNDFCNALKHPLGHVQSVTQY